jgi:hypothetical protein
MIREKCAAVFRKDLAKTQKRDRIAKEPKTDEPAARWSVTSAASLPTSRIGLPRKIGIENQLFGLERQDAGSGAVIESAPCNKLRFGKWLTTSAPMMERKPENAKAASQRTCA